MLRLWTPVLRRCLSSVSLLTLLLTASASSAREPLRITLDEALALARSHNASLLAARAGAERADAEALKTSRVFLPTVQLAEAYAATDHPFLGSVLRGTLTPTGGTAGGTGGGTGGTPDDGTSGGTGGAAPTSTVPETESTFFSVAPLTPPIINVEGWLLRRRASLAAEAAELRVGRAEAELELAVLRQYYGLHVAEERLQAVRAGVEAARQAVETAEGLHAEGLAPPVDVHRARAEAARARAALARARADAEAMQARTRLLLGVDEPVSIVPADPLPDPRGAALEEDAAVHDRGDVAAQQAKVAAAEAALKSSQWAYLPRLTGLAAYERQGDAPLAGDVEGWFVGAMLTWTPFAGLSRYGEVRVKQAELREEQLRLTALEREARAEIEVARAELGAALVELHERRAELEEARAAQRLARQRYAEGLAPITELLAADAGALEAALQVAAGRHAAVVAEASLRLALGRLRRQR